MNNQLGKTLPQIIKLKVDLLITAFFEKPKNTSFNLFEAEMKIGQLRIKGERMH